MIGHLVDSACNNHQRFVRAQHCDELIFPKYEQNEWVAAANYRNCDWSSLVELFYHYNRQISHLIRCRESGPLEANLMLTDRVR